MKVVVGLGNPGKEYANSRHNVGFMVLRQLQARAAKLTTRQRFRSELAEGFVVGQKVTMVAPQTFMNVSGQAVREVIHWYRVDLQDLLVVYDDMDLAFGQLRMRADGSAGGHNGLRSIIEHLGSEHIPRLRVGIGRGRSGGVGHVLSRFSPDEEAVLAEVLTSATDSVVLWLNDGVTVAMNRTNRRKSPSDRQPDPLPPETAHSNE